MNPISHKQAHQWIHKRLDGLLTESQTADLGRHLQTCAACRGYAARLEQLDIELRQTYHERAQTRQLRLKHSALSNSAIHTLQKQMRFKMKSKQVLNFATSLTFYAAMTILIVGVFWLTSIKGKLTPPNFNGHPASIATSTPFPWTKDAPLTSLDQIESILNDLARRNFDAFQQAAWVHTIRRDLGQGTIRSSYSESWSHYPEDDQTCTESLELVTEQPGDTANYLQILISLSDGTFGDLIQLREGSGQITSLPPGSDGCSLKPEFTPAGQFAARLKEEQAASSDEKMSPQAWYEILEGRPVFVVAVTFTAPSKGNYTGVTKEARSFDIENGVIVQETVRMEWEDGSLFGESQQGYVTEFAVALPDETAAQWERFSSELKAYASGTLPQPTPIATRDGDPIPVVEDQQYVSSAAPITDGQTILKILGGLKQRQVERLSKPGWYIYGPQTVDATNWMNNRYMLVHTIDGNGACDYMSYYVKDGKILPQEIVLADGRWGGLGVVEDGQIGNAGKGKIIWSNGPMTDTCHVSNVETVSFVENETRYFEDIVDGKTQGTYKAWTEESSNGRKFFVLYYDVEFNGFGTVMDSDTRQLEPIDHNEKWIYFDLYWGTVLVEAQQDVFHLQNEKIIGTAPTDGMAIDVNYLYFTEPPADLKAVYEETVAKLEAYFQE